MNSVLILTVCLSYFPFPVKSQAFLPVKLSDSLSHFSFDLSNPAQSESYRLCQVKKHSANLSVMVPVLGQRMTRLLDGAEVVAKFEPDELVTKVVFYPQKNPTLLSYTYVKNNVYVTKRLRKAFVWSPVSAEDFAYLLYQHTEDPVEVILDVSNLDGTKFGLKRELYFGHQFDNFYTNKGYHPARVVDGNQVLWESENNAKVFSGFVSFETLPRFVTFTVLTHNRLDIKHFISYGEGFHEVDAHEFHHVLKNLTVKTRTDVVLDVEKLDTSYLEVSSFEDYKVPFTNVYGKLGFRVEKVTSGDHVLWTKAPNTAFVFLSYTEHVEPRYYHLLLFNAVGETREYKSHYYMSQNGSFYTLPLEEFEENVKKLQTKDVFESFDLKSLMESVREHDLFSLMYAPLVGVKVKSVVYGEDLVWIAPEDEMLERLHFFKQNGKFLVQVTSVNNQFNTTTRHFQHSSSYFKGDESDAWLWVSAPEFYSNVLISELTKTYTYLDFANKVDMGVFEHKLGSVDNVRVQTFVPYYNYSVTSVQYNNNILWMTSNKETLAALALYGSKPATPVEKGTFEELYVKGFTLAELYVKGDDKVTRQFYRLNHENKWSQLNEADFLNLYNQL